MPQVGSLPKSACRKRLPPAEMAAMYPSDFGTPGSERTSWFQALSAGNTGHGPTEVDPPGAAGDGAGGAGGAGLAAGAGAGSEAGWAGAAVVAVVPPRVATVPVPEPA